MIQVRFEQDREQGVLSMELRGHAGFAALGAVQWFRRGSLRKVDQAVWALAALYAVVAVLYVFFEKVVINYRPVLMAGETRPEASFPSTHTMLACVVFGSAAIALGRYIRNETLRKALDECDAVVIGAGAGLSTAAGLAYDGERFQRYFGDFEFTEDNNYEHRACFIWR